MQAHQNYQTLQNVNLPRVYMPRKTIKYSVERTIYKLKNTRFDFDFSIHPKIDLILKAYFLNYKSTRIIGLAIGKSSETIRQYILRSKCKLRKAGKLSKVSFTHEHELFLRKHYFMRPRMGLGVIIVRFNSAFNTNYTYTNIVNKYIAMGIMDE